MVPPYDDFDTHTTVEEGLVIEADWKGAYQEILVREMTRRLLRVGTFEEDTTMAGDMVFMKNNRMVFACRLRTWVQDKRGLTYAQKYPWDVTVTCRRETGYKCEYDKMIATGRQDWFFYGHAASPVVSTENIYPWYVIDLSVAREWMKRNHGEELGPNRDRVGRRCWFYAYNIMKMKKALGPDVLIAMAPPIFCCRVCKEPLPYDEDGCQYLWDHDDGRCRQKALELKLALRESDD